jgi:hypothetical protein
MAASRHVRRARAPSGANRTRADVAECGQLSRVAAGRDVEVSESGWRDLFESGKARKR